MNVPIKGSSADEMSEIDHLVDQIHALVDRLVSKATDGRRATVEEIELVRDEDGIRIRGDVPGAPSGELDDGELPGGVLIELPFDGDRPGRIIA